MRLKDGITNRNTLNSFNLLYEKFIRAHGAKYDYSKVIFTNMATKVIITCPEHGDFEQTPHCHIHQKSGCPECANLLKGTAAKTRHKVKRMPTLAWVTKANEIHNNKYDYSLTEFTGVSNKVTITCPIHGNFTQVAYSHLKGYGCSKCANILSTEQFIKKAQLVHKGKYDYTQSRYNRHDSKIVITCFIHGEFEQEAHSHLRGCGCPNCANRGFKKELPGILYYFRIHRADKVYYKIGITNRDLNSRYTKEELVNCEILYEEPFDVGFTAHYLEMLILNSNKDKKVNLGILKTGNTEIFKEDVFDYTQRKHYEIYKTNSGSA